LTVLLSGLALVGAAIALDYYLREGGTRMVSAGLLLAVAGVVMAVMAAIWTREPEPWRHHFFPRRHADGNLDRLVVALGTECPPSLPVIMPDRVLSATWVREVLTERLMTGAGLDPPGLAFALEHPLDDPALGDRPAMRRFLDETRDLGVARKGTVLTLQRKEFLKLADAAMKEAGSL